MTDGMAPLPFDHQPDPELGAALRAALDGPEPEEFLARLRAAVPAERETSVQVLSRWAPYGMVAAAAAAAVLWALARPLAAPAAGPAPLLASVPVQMEAQPQHSESEVLVISLLEDR